MATVQSNFLFLPIKVQHNSLNVNFLAEKIQWFKDCIAVNEEKNKYSMQDIHDMIDM